MQLMMFQFLQGEANFQNYREQDVKIRCHTSLQQTAYCTVTVPGTSRRDLLYRFDQHRNY